MRFARRTIFRFPSRNGLRFGSVISDGGMGEPIGSFNRVAGIIDFAVPKSTPPSGFTFRRTQSEKIS